MRNLLVAGVLCFLMTPTGFAQFVAELPIDGGPITIRNYEDREWRLNALDFNSANGDLIPAPLISVTGFDGESQLVGDPAPFTFMLANSPNQVTYGNLGTQVTFAADSCTVLTAGVRPNAEVFGSLGGGATPVAIRVDLVDTVCSVPEPGGGCLVALGLLGLLACRRYIAPGSRSGLPCPGPRATAA